MSKAVSLSEILAALQFSDPTTVVAVDRTTGQIVESAQTPSEATADVDRFEPLPTLTEQDELDLARRFVVATAKDEDRKRLDLALYGANPQETFETSLFRCQIANAWFQFRDEQLLQRAKQWLETRGVPYRDDLLKDAN